MAVYANYFHSTKHVTISDSADGERRYQVEDADGLLASVKEWNERFGVKKIYFECAGTNIETNMRWIRAKAHDIMDTATLEWCDDEESYDDYDEEGALDSYMDSYIDEYQANQNFLD